MPAAAAGSTGSSAGSSSASGAPAAISSSGRSSVRLTETRIPSSSISTSATPLSWTIRTSSRIRCSRVWSSVGVPKSSRVARARIVRSSASASSPKSAIRTSSSSLAARPFGLLADVLGGRRVLVERHPVREERDGARDRRVDLRRRAAVAPLHEGAELVDDGAVPPRGEDVDQRLRGEDLADRGGERRPAGLAADRLQLLQRLEQPVAGGVRAQVRVERGDEAGRQVVLGGADRETRRVRRHDLVADVLVDEVGGLPEPVDVDAGVEPHPGERRRQRLAGDAVERERERVDGAGDQVGSGARGLDRVGHAAAARALAVEADRQPGGLGDARDELARLVRLQAARRVVDQSACRVQVGELAGLLDERVGGALSARAVDEPRVELLAGADDRLAGLAQVRDVVERVVQAEDVDPVLRRGGDEAADEVAADRARADEEAAAEREPERRRRPALERADALPRALDAAAHGGVEDAAAGDLEARESRLVEHLGERQQLGGRDLPRERFLREQADSGVYEPRHVLDPTE